jgi:two-component system response regulator HydG
VPVLIVGETGVGKESIARRIHEHSSRAGKCYVPVNCPAITESLFESEYFGHEKGSYTGATEARDGKFQLADGGTLFLDEVGELAGTMQPKLLRALQEGEVQRVGGKPAKVDVRIVAATNIDLQKAIREGKFRQDLFYRLNGIIIRVPSLRERTKDIPLLVQYFMKKHGKGTNVTSIDEDAMAAISRYDWPGNVRELEQVIRSAMVLAKAGRRAFIAPAHLPGEVVKPDDLSKPATLKEQVDKLADATRRTAARAMMAECGGDAKRAAAELGISKRYLHYLLEK